ncbi:copper resistance protein CopC [Sphaerisporangium sp. NPDC088356]|uniref:copper resistance CopC family protein n=1 Tax=Sphaerisporangium sp. NPDC088356 TaxID=3154871 RepID=UPI003417D858
MRFPVIRALLALCLSGVVVGLAAPPALAHDSLKSSSPAKDSTVSRLDQIELEFSAHASFPVVVLHDAAGRRFESGPPRTDGSKVFESVAGPLPPGGYVIAWRIVSSDGHPVEGEIPFTVQGAQGGTGAPSGAAQPTGAAAGASAAPAPAPADTASRAGVPVWVWAGLGVLVVVGAAVLLTGRRSSRTDGETPAPQPDPTPEPDAAPEPDGGRNA